MGLKRILPVLLLVLLFCASVPNVFARGETFVIEPMKEVTERIESQASDSCHIDVRGNLSVLNDSFVDFYVTDPSGIMFLCYNKTSFVNFNFAMEENGTYLMHMVNAFSANNVTALLSYGLNFQIVLQESVHMSFTSVATQTIIARPSIDIWQILVQSWNVLVVISSGISAVIGVTLTLLALVGFIRWKLKYRKPRTPSDSNFSYK
jgi:hypothetical protein